jgi:putative transposase
VSGVQCSMSRSGDFWDVVAMESCFLPPKTERIGKKPYHMRDAARADEFDYVEWFYNTVRKNLTISHLSPIKFKEKAGPA